MIILGLKKMKVIRIAILMVVLCCFFSQSIAQGYLRTRKTDSLKFERTLYDFGEITEGSVIRHKFEFMNGYNRVINLTLLEKSCNCTNVILGKSDLNTHDQSFLELIVDTDGKCGAFYSNVIISANTHQKFYKIGIKGNVINCKNDAIK